MFIGAAYYPELWDESEIEKDIAVCKTVGLNTLRIGEFAWSSMEPEEGRFNWGWLDHVMDRLHAAGISVILCTPTCTPPRWLMNRYPETRQLTDEGLRVEVSSRLHPCKSSPIMREKNRIIVTEMAQRYGHHPALIGWQIDNELFPVDNGCHCQLCRENFRRYLKERFGTIEALNEAFGMDRWSLTYDSFEDVLPPKRSEWAHPSLKSAWFSFVSQLTISYAEEQADILHAHSDAPVSTDMMPMNQFPSYDLMKKMDIVQINHYDTADSIARTVFLYNFMRPIKERPFWVTETQVGWNGNIFSANGYRPVGNCYVNTWLPFAYGAEMNLYWLFRAHAAGHELAHGAIVSSCGRPYRVTEEVTAAAKDIDKCKSFLKSSGIKAKIAFHNSSLAENMFIAAPMLEKFNYSEMMRQIFAPLRQYNTDIIDPSHSLDGYEVVISPFLSCINHETRERIRKWVETGGTWIVGPMSDFLDENLKKCTDAPYYFLEEMAGVYTVYQKPIANSVFKAVWKDGTPAGISTCYDAYRPVSSSPLIVYAGDEFDGYAAVTEKKVGKGKVILLGTVLDAPDLMKLVGREPIAKATSNLCLVERSGKENGIIVLELENKKGMIDLEGQYTDLISGRTLTGRIDVQPYEVLVLRKQ